MLEFRGFSRTEVHKYVETDVQKIVVDHDRRIWVVVTYPRLRMIETPDDKLITWGEKKGKLEQNVTVSERL